MGTAAHDGQSAAHPQPPQAERDATLAAPVNVRSLALAVLAVLGTLFAMRWASPVLIPVMVGVMFSYALSPVVDRLARWRVPRALASALLIIASLGGIVGLVYSLSDDVNDMIEELPAAARKLQQSLREKKQEPGPIDKVQQAAKQIEQVAQEAGPKPTNQRGVSRVVVEKPRFDVRDLMWTSTVGLFALVAQATLVSFLAFFILASGDAFRRKMVSLAGPTFTEKKITVQVMDEITAQIERYLLVQLFTSTLVGIVTWLVFLWIGVEHAAVWGVLAGVLNFVPYVGAVLVTGGAMVVGLLQFGTIEMALAIGGASLVIQMLEGYLLTPWLTSKASKMSPVVIFVGVLFWGWLWGGWGLILGVPILMTVKSVCDHVEDLQPIGELLGEEPRARRREAQDSKPEA